MQSSDERATRLRGRLYVCAAAMLWGTSGLFAKARLFDDWPSEDRGLLLAFWRALFAGLLMLPFVRRPRWRPMLVPMALSFTGMNFCYMTSMALGTAANAIWLQSTSPLWVVIFGVLILRETFSRRDAVPIVCGLAGIGWILINELHAGNFPSVAYGLASGLLYAGVVLSLRYLRDEASAYLVTLNHLAAALLLAPYVIHLGHWPSLGQLAVLAGFGFFQMALPYVCFARGLRLITSQEASGIGLLEPIMVPIWTYLAWSEVPAEWTLLGGGLILAGLVLRYGVLVARAPLPAVVEERSSPEKP